MTIILHPYTELATRGEERYRKTWQLITFLSVFSKERVKVESRLTTKYDDEAYYKVLKSVWAKDDLLIIEEDKIASIDQVTDIINCPKPCCTGFYKIYFTDTTKGNLPSYVWSVGDLSYVWSVGNMNTPATQEPYPKQEYYHFAGTGFLKISLELQKKTNLDLITHRRYQDGLDMQLFKIMSPIDVHLHSPEVEHRHQR